MERNTKGFTLIELLAVMVILAIIALIATPVVMNVINNAKREATENSVYGIIKAAEVHYTRKLLETGEFNDTIFVGTGESLTNGMETLEYKGTIPTYGTILITSKGNVIISNLKIDGFTCNMGNNDVICYK